MKKTVYEGLICGKQVSRFELNKENCGRCKSYFETDDCIVEEMGKITAKRSVS